MVFHPPVYDCAEACKNQLLPAVAEFVLCGLVQVFFWLFPLETEGKRCDNDDWFLRVSDVLYLLG
jgi:hypothetical protein